MASGILKNSTLFLVAFLTLAIALQTEVLAQGNPISETASSSATTSDAISLEGATTTEASWYRSEQIFGNIEVGDFLVGPGRTEVKVKPGETVIREVIVTNRISDNRVFKLEIEDITGSSDGSSEVSLAGEEKGPYSLRDYISVPQDTFTLKLGERAIIPVTIAIPADAEPGGFYGSVLVSTIQAPQYQGEGTSRSPIIARIGSLFFVTVEGDVFVEGKPLSISTVHDKWWYEKGPIELGILYENTGSLHVNPYGELSITNMLGEEVGFIELEPWFVLPKSLRTREVTWDREFLFGRYVVTAKINRGYEDVVDELSVAFWVLPWKLVGGLFLVLFIILFSIRAFFRKFEFKRKGD